MEKGTETEAMTTVGIRDLGRNPSEVVDEVTRTGRPAIVTRNGRPVAVMLPISEEDLEDYILANAPVFVRARNDADRDFAEHRTRSLRDSLAEMGEPLPAGSAAAKPVRRSKKPTARRAPSTGTRQRPAAKVP